MKAIRVHCHGGPDVLTYEDVAIGEPGPGEIRVRNKAIGLNYADVYYRTGEYRPSALPFTPGLEGAGEVVAVGPDVRDFACGDRVAYYSPTLGAYAEEQIVPAHYVASLPHDIDFETAAALMLKGLTAQYLLHRTFRVEPGHIILVHAAAGGVGLLLTQWAKHLGATVIGTVGSPEKAELAREYGCDYVIDRNEDFVARVRAITGGEGCQVVYDSIGKATFPASLDCLRRFGFFVSFGSPSGPIDPFDITLLARKGSLYATWPSLPHYLARREDVLAMSENLFRVVASGAVKIPIHARLPLADVVEAHRRLESRKTTGSTVLLP